MDPQNLYPPQTLSFPPSFHAQLPPPDNRVHSLTAELSSIPRNGVIPTTLAAMAGWLGRQGWQVLSVSMVQPYPHRSFWLILLFLPLQAVAQALHLSFGFTALATLATLAAAIVSVVKHSACLGIIQCCWPGAFPPPQAPQSDSPLTMDVSLSGLTPEERAPLDAMVQWLGQQGRQIAAVRFSRPRWLARHIVLLVLYLLSVIPSLLEPLFLSQASSDFAFAWSVVFSFGVIITAVLSAVLDYPPYIATIQYQ